MLAAIRVRPVVLPLLKSLHTSALIAYPRNSGKNLKHIHRGPFKPPEKIQSVITTGDEDLEIDEFNEVDETSYELLVSHERKRILKYLRLIERDAPVLRQLRRPFKPPASKNPVIVRAITYSGEYHPVLRKRVIVVPTSQLPLESPEMIHKCQLLAGVRWSEQPPRDSGIGREEHESVGRHGYIKISCEDFPEPEMNLKWCMDTLKLLLSQARDMNDTFADIPLDKRHLIAKGTRDHKGEQRHGPAGPRPSIRDFPKEWLPPSRQPQPAM